MKYHTRKKDIIIYNANELLKFFIGLEIFFWNCLFCIFAVRKKKKKNFLLFFASIPFMKYHTSKKAIYLPFFGKWVVEILHWVGDFWLVFFSFFSSEKLL
jgi:hypothetical protein